MSFSPIQTRRAAIADSGYRIQSHGHAASSTCACLLPRLLPADFGHAGATKQHASETARGLGSDTVRPEVSVIKRSYVRKPESVGLIGASDEADASQTPLMNNGQGLVVYCPVTKY